MGLSGPSQGILGSFHHSSAGSGCPPNTPTRQSRCRAPPAAKPHVWQNPSRGSLPPLPMQSPGGQRESYTLASTSASPSVSRSSPPQGLLSLPSVPSFQLVIGLGGQNCEKCLKQITRPPHRCSFVCCFTPFACWLLIKGTEADPAPPHSQPRSRLLSVAFSSLPPSPAAEHQFLCPPSSHLLNVWPGSHQPAGA